MKSTDKKTRKLNPQGLKALLNFFAEAGLLKRVKRSGWWVAGIKDPESVAEHSFRTAVIGYCLAHQEKVDPYPVVLMALFNDIHEARINDLHKMGHSYIDFKSAEKKVFHDQMRPLDGNMKDELTRLRWSYDEQKTRASIVARDADILECLIQAKEYLDEGFKGANSFLRCAPKFLRTKSAQGLWRLLKKWDSHAWWRHVVKFER